MLYYKYNSSFRKAKALSNLLEEQKIDRIAGEEFFNKRFAKGEDIYAFICPYFLELEQKNVLTWAPTEGEAWDLYYDAQQDI